MQTKSNIQLIREGLAIRDAFKDNVKSIMDKYTVEDSYFGPSMGMPVQMIKETHSIAEYTKGYFVFEHEYTDIDEAISNMTLSHVLRIIENKRFQIGKRFERLSEAKGDRVIDITTGTAAIGTEEGND